MSAFRREVAVVGLWVMIVLPAALIGLHLQAPTALAYDKTGSGRGCIDCHPADPGRQRSGPHGGYTTGTAKCATCHSIHASGSAEMMPAQSSRATCTVCHDDTGGSGVYGVLESRGITPLAIHRIDVTGTVPSGALSGESSQVEFSGQDGTLTCIDCHSPHDNACVPPFIGDRARGAADTSGTLVASDRLLRQRPTGAETSTATYGPGWCVACHKGRARYSGGAGMGPNHPVSSESSGGAEPLDYSHVAVVTGPDSRETTIGALGGSNFGYVMPDLGGGVRTAEQAGSFPICQQCHEDARNVGNSVVATDGALNPARQGTIATNELFTVGEPDTGSVTTTYTGPNNPRFQTFPHEGTNRGFLIETDDNLCLNCHLP